MINFIGFAPDAQPDAPGALMECVNIIPTLRGMEAGPGFTLLGGGTAPDVATSAFVGRNTQGVSRLIVSAGTNMYEHTSAGGGLASVSTVQPSAYSFATFGDYIIATNIGDTAIRGSAYSAATPPSVPVGFSPLTGAPRARIVVAAKDFVLAFNTNDTTFGASPDRWWCSAFQDANSWAVNPVTQANTGRLVGFPGAITAAAMLGDVCIAYKSSGAYLGRYAGPPEVWQWSAIDSAFGCVGPRAVCDVDGAHVVVGKDDIWLFDGSRPVSIAEGTVKAWFSSQCSTPFRGNTTVVHERENARVWIFFPDLDSSTGALTRALVYHLRSRRWGRANLSVDAVASLHNVAHSANTASFSATDTLVVFNSAGMSQMSDRTPTTTSFFETADVGDDFDASFVSGVQLHFSERPGAATCFGYTRDYLAGARLTRDGVALYDSRFPVTQEGRWHSFRFVFNAVKAAFSGMALERKKAGHR